MKKILLVTLLLAMLLPALSFTQSAYPKKVTGWTVVSVAVSEYPSWSTYFVGHMLTEIDSRKGWVGPIEEKWHRDVVIMEAEYDPCLMAYANGQVDAVCATEIDILNGSFRLPAVGILPTSTSYGGDKCLVADSIKTFQQLKLVKNYMLRASVSEFLTVRVLEDKGENPRDYLLENMDPGAAALAMQQRQPLVQALTTWNPYIRQTIQKRSDVYPIYTSELIPGEIIDMVFMTQKMADSPGGDSSACVLIDTYYQVNKALANPKTHDRALIGIGKKFANFTLAEMEIVVKETIFYGTPQLGIPIYSGGNVFPFIPGKTNDNLQDVMKKVIRFCMNNGVIDLSKYPNPPTVGYGTKGSKPVNLRFDPSFMQKVQASYK